MGFYIESTSNSLDSIERLFDPDQIKNVVESLVFQRFKFEKKHRKMQKEKQELLSGRRDESFSFSESQFLSDALGSNDKLFNSGASQESSSVRTSNIISLISRGSSLRTDSSSIFTSSLHPDVKHYYTILELVNYQKNQILKAIYYDSLSKNRKYLSDERIEAEKLLLLLDIKSNVLLEVIENSTKSTSIESFLIQECTATVTLSNICFMLNDLRHMSARFLCVVTCGSKLLASELTTARRNNLIQVKSTFMIPSMKRDDKIRVNLYAIKKKQKKRPYLPSMCSEQQLHLKRIEIPERESLFEFYSGGCLTIEDLTKLHLYQNSSLEIENGWLTADVNSFLNLGVHETKFINVSKNPRSHPIWNLQWCVLNNTVLKYYNYPSDSLAVEEINIEECSVKRLRKINHSTKKMILLTTNTGDNYFFSFDTESECLLWKNCFNYIISNLKFWKF